MDPQKGKFNSRSIFLTADDLPCYEILELVDENGSTYEVRRTGEFRAKFKNPWEMIRYLWLLASGVPK